MKTEQKKDLGLRLLEIVIIANAIIPIAFALLFGGVDIKISVTERKK